MALDHYLHNFTNDLGGNMMQFITCSGWYRVYLILPAFGVFSETISTFSGKALFGYRSLVPH
jgi:cytochrome o ubiquinol oxidase subunit 1